MSRFFAQLLLSIMIGVGTAVGFRSDVRGELNKTIREAKVSLHETAKITLGSAADVISNLSLDGSLNTNSQTTVGADALGLELALKNKAKSTLDVGLDILK